jgi:hypothetical protein
MKKMTGKAKIIAVCLIALLALGVVPYIPQAEPLPTGSIQGIARAELPLAEPPPKEPPPVEPPPKEPPPVEIVPVKLPPPPDIIRKEIEEAEKHKNIARKHLLAWAWEVVIPRLAGVPMDVEAERRHREEARAAFERARTHGQRAVDEANRHYGTEVPGARYCPFLQGEGAAVRQVEGIILPDGTFVIIRIQVNIIIGNGALRFEPPDPDSPGGQPPPPSRISPGWLASTKIHEQKHAEQFRDLERVPLDANLTYCSPLLHELEAEAYQAELDAADRLPCLLDQEERREVEMRRDYHLGQLPNRVIE